MVAAAAAHTLQLRQRRRPHPARSTGGTGRPASQSRRGLASCCRWAAGPASRPRPSALPHPSSDPQPQQRECVSACAAARSHSTWSLGSLRPAARPQVVGRARVPLPPQTLFAVITHPESERIFRHLLSCENRWGAGAQCAAAGHATSGCRLPALWLSCGTRANGWPSGPGMLSCPALARWPALAGRRVLQEGGPGEVTVVESEHRAAWRFLLFSGTLRTRWASLDARPCLKHARSHVARE